MPAAKSFNKLQRPQSQSCSAKEGPRQEITGAACIYFYDTDGQPKEQGRRPKEKKARNTAHIKEKGVAERREAEPTTQHRNEVGLSV